MNWRLLTILFIQPLASLAASPQGGNGPEERLRTAYLHADYGMGTYKSALMESNDTNGVVSYGIGTYAGERKQLGVEYKVETATTAFALDSSSLAMKWDTTIIKYRLWAFEMGPVIGSVTAKGNRAGTDIFDAAGSGYGGYFGTVIPIGRHSIIDLKVTQCATGEMIDKNLAEVAVGPRMDLELSSRIGITRRNLSATIGYRRRTYTITEAGTSYAELQTATYVGFITGFDF